MPIYSTNSNLRLQTRMKVRIFPIPIGNNRSYQSMTLWEIMEVRSMAHNLEMARIRWQTCNARLITYTIPGMSSEMYLLKWISQNILRSEPVQEVQLIINIRTTSLIMTIMI